MFLFKKKLFFIFMFLENEIDNFILFNNKIFNDIAKSINISFPKVKRSVHHVVYIREIFYIPFLYFYFYYLDLKFIYIYV